MNIEEFKLERYFALHEFSAKYLMSSSDCDGFAMQHVLQHASPAELDMWSSLRLGYTDSAGSECLRKSIAQHYSGFGADEIVVASPGELNFITMNILLKPADHVVVVSPCYQSLVEVVRSIGCEVSMWQPNPSSWSFDVDELEQLVTDRTRLIIINFPHNPTGAYLSVDELKRVVEIASRRGIYLFSDEMYRFLVHGGVQELPPACELYTRAISLWGTSKTFGLAGLRVGWLVSRDREFLQRVLAFKDYLSICSSAPSEMLAAMALNSIGVYLKPNLQKIALNIGLFKEFVERSEVFADFIAPRAGSTALVRLNISGAALDFCNRLVAETGIMCVPAEMFDYSDKYVRVGFGRSNFADVLMRLEAYFGAGNR